MTVPPPRPTAVGVAAICLAATTFALGAVLLSGAVLAVSAAAAFLVVACRYAAARHLGDFAVERSLPRRARAGESFPLETRLDPGRRFPAGAELRFTDPLAPAVRGRRIETAPGAPTALRCTGLAHRRGHLPRQRWALASTWPLGLFLTERQGEFRDDHSTLVLPKPWMPPRLRSRLERLSEESADQPFESSDPLAEFRLLREFRPGDPVRGLHWPASLRSGRLQFAETEPPRPRPPRCGLFLHSYEAPGTVIVPEAWERILRVAAGLISHFRHEGATLVLSLEAGKVARLREPGDFVEALDDLALLRRRPSSCLAAIFSRHDGAGESGKDVFAGCDEVFVLGDSALADWETAARERFPRCTCYDSKNLSTRPAPGLRLRSRAAIA